MLNSIKSNKVTVKLKIRQAVFFKRLRAILKNAMKTPKYKHTYIQIQSCRCTQKPSRCMHIDVFKHPGMHTDVHKDKGTHTSKRQAFHDFSSRHPAPIGNTDKETLDILL